MKGTDDSGSGEAPQTHHRRTVTAKPWLTVPEMAVYYEISVATIRNWLKTGKLNPSNGAHRLGENWRINRSEFESKFMDASKGA